MKANRYFDVSGRTPIDDCMAPRRLQRRGVLLHGTAGTSSLSWLQRKEPVPARRSSADFLVSRGGLVYQVGRPGYYTYHAGLVLWRGVLLTPLEANQTLIGIEFENIEDGHQALTNVQYIVGAALVARLQGVHGLDVRSFDTHGHVARPAGRKTDPKTFSWSVFVNEMYNPSIEASELVFPAVLP